MFVLSGCMPDERVALVAVGEFTEGAPRYRDDTLFTPHFTVVVAAEGFGCEFPVEVWS